MTAAEFLASLERELAVLTPEERAEAMDYYREYLEDAGEEEAQAIASLGSPQSVAERIIREVGTGGNPYGASKTYKSSAYRELYEGNAVPPPPTKQGDRIGLTIIVLILTSPLWIVAWSIWLSAAAVLVSLPLAFAFGTVVGPIQGAMFFADGLHGAGLYDIGSGLLCLGLLLFLWKPCLKGLKYMTIGFGKASAAIVRGLLGRTKEA